MIDSWVASGKEASVRLHKGQKNRDEVISKAKFTKAELEAAQPLQISTEPTFTDMKNKIQVKVQLIPNKGNSRGVIAATPIKKGIVIATCGPMKRIQESQVELPKYEKWARYIWMDENDSNTRWIPNWGDPQHICFHGLLLNTPNIETGEEENCLISWYPIRRFGRVQDELVVISRRKIKEGEELMFSYGKMYANLLLRERKAALLQEKKEQKRRAMEMDMDMKPQILERKNVGRGRFYLVVRGSGSKQEEEPTWVNRKDLPSEIVDAFDRNSVAHCGPRNESSVTLEKKPASKTKDSTKDSNGRRSSRRSTKEKDPILSPKRAKTRLMTGAIARLHHEKNYKPKPSQEDKTFADKDNVNKILKAKNVGRGRFYLIQWKGNREPEWVNRKNLLGNEAHEKQIQEFDNDNNFSDSNDSEEEEEEKEKEKEFDVETVLDRKNVGRGTFYLVKWVGYDKPTWENQKTLMEDIPEMIAEYDASHEFK
jgi:hypothetical protein